jgi:hypothetical protein
VEGSRRRPGLVRAVVLATESLVDDLVSLTAANLLFGAALLVTIVAAQVHIVGILLFIPLSLPTAGVMRMAAWHVRRGSVRFSVFIDGLRRWPHVLALATAQLVAAALLALDLSIGTAGTDPGSIMLTVAAIYGAAALWIAAVVGWPIVLDPERDDDPLVSRLRGALVLALAQPLRCIGIGAIVGLLLAAAAFTVVALLAFGLALACLVAAHYVLPAADLVEGRMVDD